MMMLERAMRLYSSQEAHLLRSTISTGSFRGNVLPRGLQTIISVLATPSFENTFIILI
jgi:hypothetical protein